MEIMDFLPAGLSTVSWGQGGRSQGRAPSQSLELAGEGIRSRACIRSMVKPFLSPWKCLHFT